jgi:hypothetical protein
VATRLGAAGYLTGRGGLSGSAKVEPGFGHADMNGVSFLERAVEQQDRQPVAQLSLDDPP